MSQPFDAVLKEMVRRHVADFRDAFDLPDVNTVLDVDLSTVSAATDIVLADHDPPKKDLVTLDFQSGHDTYIDDRILMYQGILRGRYHLPIHSVVLLLRPDAYRPPMTGSVLYETSHGRGKMDFRYEMVRLWEIPTNELLEAGIGAATLAVLGKLPKRKNTESEITDVLRELNRRLRNEVQPAEANDLMTSAGVLTGLRISKEVARALVERVQTMEESTVYQVILEKGEARGRIAEAQQAILRLGRGALGSPSKAVQHAIKGIGALDRLHRMQEQLLKVDSWRDLLNIE